MNELPSYGPLPPPKPQTTVERSVSREGAFSKPGSMSKGTKPATSKPASKPAAKGWAPAKGVRFRPTNEKAVGRPRKRKLDPRYVKYL